MTSRSAIAQTVGVMSEAGTDFTARVAENQRRVFQIAYSVLGNAADAEEIAQEAFLSAYRNLHALRDAERFRGWINRTAFRLALNRQRGSRRRMLRDAVWHAGCSAEPADGAKEADTLVLLAQLRRVIASLPSRCRQVLHLSLVEDMDATEIGAVLGIPPGTVRSRLHTARKLLLERMK